MKTTKLAWRAAAAVAFLMGLPMVREARADTTTDITNSVISLVYAIIDATGNS